MKTRVLLFSALGALTAVPVLAQVPNGGFEDWITPPGASYQDPNGWITFNQLTSVEGTEPSCAQGSPGAVGSYYATVTSQNTTLFGVIPGIITVGDPLTGNTGFPMASRPTTFTGQWQYNIQAGDSGAVLVAFTKWNTATQTSDDIGAGAMYVTGSVSGWQAMNVPIEYTSGDDPDSAYVFVLSSGGDTALAGSFIKVDDLGFSNSPTGIAEQVAPNDLQLYPSLATDVLHISAGSTIDRVDLIDLTGRTVRHEGIHATHDVLSVADLKTGRYLVVAHTANGQREVRSFVKE